MFSNDEFCSLKESSDLSLSANFLSAGFLHSSISQFPLMVPVCALVALFDHALYYHFTATQYRIFTSLQQKNKLKIAFFFFLKKKKEELSNFFKNTMHRVSSTDDPNLIYISS